ncbi:MAG: universal stress protein [Rhodoferax sp.]|nr:universal stress protein [Rhodoferax sp.]MCF8209314.1 universal stress protein [Rhodoferax sp.]
MYKTILLAYDGSESGQQALIDCEELVQWSHADLWLVAVKPSPVNFSVLEGGVYDPEVEQRETARFQAILADGLDRLEKAGFSAQGELLVGDSVHEIAQFATRVHAGLIVVGHKHLDNWAARWWRGSISGALIEHAPCSVLCVITR